VYRIAWFRGRPAMNRGVHIKLAYKRATIQQSNYKEKAIYIYTTQHSQPYTMRILSTVKMSVCSALVTLGRHRTLDFVNFGGFRGFRFLDSPAVYPYVKFK